MYREHFLEVFLWVVRCGGGGGGLVPKSYLTLCDPRDYSLPGSSVHGILQVIFPTQESNPGLQHCRRILCQLNYEGSWSCEV